MASEIGKIVHCKICGAPIEARGNRLYCPVCYNQNRRNAAQRSNARTKMEREQTKREEAKMKENNRIATSAAELNMRAKLSNLGGISYGDLSIWEQTHGSSRTIFRKDSRLAASRRSIPGRNPLLVSDGYVQKTEI